MVAILEFCFKEIHSAAGFKYKPTINIRNKLPQDIYKKIIKKVRKVAETERGIDILISNCKISYIY